METPTIWGLNNQTDYFERVEQMHIARKGESKSTFKSGLTWRKPLGRCMNR